MGPGMAVNMYGAIEEGKQKLEKSAVTSVLKNFGVADEFQEEEAPRDYKPGDSVQSLAGDVGVVLAGSSPTPVAAPTLLLHLCSSLV
jgi:hypothetical protein